MPRWLLSLARRFGISARTTRKARKRTFPSPLRIEELEDRLTPSTTLNLTLTGPTYAVPGSNATYVVTLANTDNNNNAAANVILGDGLPSGTTLASQTQVSGPSLSLGTFVGNPYDTIATLPAGSSVTVDIVAALNSSLSNGATLTDTAGALTSTQLSGSSVTSASVTTTVQSQADLAVSLSAPCTALPGANIAWTLTVSNNGPNAAQSVTLSDTPPTGTTFVSQSEGSGPSFTLTHNGNVVSDTISTLSSGASATFTVTMQVNRGVAAGTALSATATVSSNTSDPNSGNNSASASTTVTNPVTLAAPANQGNYEADAVSLALSGSDALSGTTLSYSGQGLPPGLSVNGSSGVISGTVSAGDYLGSPFTVTVTAGDSTYSANQSFTWTISRLTPSESVTSALNPSTVGQGVLFTATLSGPAGVTPTGTVTFTDGSSTLGTATLSVVNGQDIATLGTSSLAVGSHTISATYSGDGNFAGSSAALTQTVKALTSTTLTSSLNPSPYGQAVTFTAAVTSPSSGTPTGTVTFSDGSSTLGTATLAVVSGQDQATLSTAALSVGNNTITAVYGGDSGFAGSSAAPLTQVEHPVLSWVGPGFNWSQSPTPPVVTNPGTQGNAEGDTVSLQISATDPNGYSLSYDAVNLPSGLAMTGNGRIVGTIGYEAAEDFGGSYDATVFVTDAQGESSNVSFTWTVSDTPRPPVVGTMSNQSNAAGGTVSLQVSASQPDGDALSYDASGLPPGLVIDSNSGLISGTIDPSAASAIAYTVTVTVTDSTPTTAQTTNESFTWTVGAATPSPALDNPQDQVNAGGDLVDLSLSGTDGGGYPLTYTANGLPAGLSIDPGSGAITGTIANSAVSATPYTVTVMASDGQTSNTQTFQWTVGAVSLTNPGDQQNVDGATVSLSITAADVANNSLTYSVTGLPAGLSINSSSGVISGTLGSTADAASPYSVSVTTTDGTYSANTSFTWEVDRVTLANPGDQQNRDGNTVSLALNATDLAGTPSFSASGLPSGLSINSSTGLIAGTIASAAHGQSPYQVTVTATDGAASSSQSLVWTVTPQVVLVSPGPRANAAGDTVSLAVSAHDLPNNPLTYAISGLPSGLSINSTTGVISGTISTSAVSASPYTVTVTASDGTYSSSQTFPWSVATIALAAPGDQSNLDDDAVSLALTAAYHGTGTLSYSASGLPDGLSISSTTGLISGTLSNTADANGPYAVTVTATDGTNNASQSFPWTVDPRVSVDAVSDQATVPGATVSMAVSARDVAPGTVTLSYSASGLPAGLSIASSTGLISGTVTASISSSPHVVTVTANDGAASTSQTFNWSVVPVTLSNPGDQVSVGGATVNLALTADVAGGYTAGYSASGLPAGLSINSGTGVISGTPASGDTGQSYLVTVAATAGGVTSSQTFTWRVGIVVVAAPADQTSTEGDSVSLAVSAWTVSGTLSYSASGLPAGLSMDGSSGVISGTIPAGTAAAGPYTVTVVATNGTVADSQTFSWTVNPRVVVDPIDDQSNQEGDSVSLQVSASEVSPWTTMSYSATGLPDGLSIGSSTGLISGTVATGAAANGPYTADVTATDGTYSTDVEFGWTITAGTNSAPTLTTPGTQVNVVGDSVNLVVSATDPDGDALSYSADGLPDGLAIDPDTGIISGTVAEDAVSSTPYSVTLTVDDGDGGTTTGTFLWVANDSALVLQEQGITAEEGIETGAVTVATFTDSDPNWGAGDFSATIQWGDGTTDSAEVDGSNGNFTVSGWSHMYAQPGAYTTQVSVTDGFETITATGTATVSAAPLTLSGDVVEGAVAGSAVSSTWASFTDANPNDAASSYTVTINWGDNSALTTGTVTGFGGTFIVSGGHNYATAGTYTVTVSVTDPQGTSASATSTAQVGDIFAGVKASLTVASFTSNDPNATAGQFTATVNWGDGSALDHNVTVTGANGTFTVQGSHTYAVDSLDESGGAYPVTVTVQDPYGSTLTATQGVHVERPPMQGVGEDVLAQPGVAITNVEVATFTEPDLSDSTSEFTATISWGDGSSSSGTVVGSGGVFHVLGSHTYAAVGEFPIQVSISQAWQTFSTTLYLLGAAAAPAAVPASINGPDAVPGNSRYVYSVVLPPGVTVAALKQYDWASSDTGVATITIEGGAKTTKDDWKTVYSLYAVFEFQNKPAEVTISLTYDIGDGAQTLKFTVDVVQVKVEKPDDGFVAGKPSDLGNTPAKVVIDNRTDTNIVKTLTSGADLLGAKKLAPGLKATAKITLIGPGPNHDKGVDKIKVGFIQHAELLQDEVDFPGANKKIVYDMVSTTKKTQVYLDVSDGAGPWYTATPGGTLMGTSGTIGFEDSPGSVATPMLFPAGQDFAAKMEWFMSFDLDVAAMTTESPYDTAFWREASTPWSVDLSGDITYDGKAKALDDQLKWSPIKKTGVNAPFNWFLTSDPYAEKSGGQTFQAASKATKNWTSSKL